MAYKDMLMRRHFDFINRIGDNTFVDQHGRVFVHNGNALTGSDGTSWIARDDFNQSGKRAWHRRLDMRLIAAWMNSIDFHGAVLGIYVITNVVLITLGILNLQPPDRATATDQDMVEYGVARALGPLMSLILTAVPVAFLYLLRGLFKLTRWVYRRVEHHAG